MARRKKSKCGWYVGTLRDGTLEVMRTCTPHRHGWRHAVGPLDRRPVLERERQRPQRGRRRYY